MEHITADDATVDRESDFPARHEFLGAHTAYTLARSARLNAAIFLHLSALPEGDLRRFHRDGLTLFDVRAVALDRIEPDCVVLAVPGKPSIDSAGDAARDLTPISIFNGIECFARYEREDLGMTCRDAHFEQLTRTELLEVYASFLARTEPLEALDDEWSRMFKASN